MSTDYVWIDRRWQETHWLETFRMRFCGWLPAEVAEYSLLNGLLQRVDASKETKVMLTEKARGLTDLSEGISDSPQNCRMLANVLVTKGFEASWLTAETHSAVSFLQTTEVFPKAFRDKVLGEIDPICLREDRPSRSA